MSAQKIWVLHPNLPEPREVLAEPHTASGGWIVAPRTFPGQRWEWTARKFGRDWFHTCEQAEEYLRSRRKPGKS